jgi:hypothetical protein
MIDAIRFTGTSVLTTATRRNIPEDTILQTSRRNVQEKSSVFCQFSLLHNLQELKISCDAN